MKHVLLLLLFIFPLKSYSQTNDKCNFDVKCENKFKIEFKSKSGNCVKDDTSIQFSNDQRIVTFPLRTAWYYEIENNENSESTCKSTHYLNYPIFIKNEKALMFLRKNGRPGYDLIDTILIDLKNGYVLDHVELGRYMRSTFQLLKYKDGHKIIMVSGATKDMVKDANSRIDEDWIEVKIENNKIIKNWLKQKDLK